MGAGSKLAASADTTLLKLHCFLLLKEWQEQLQHLKTFGVVQS
jgi:hypothetical protein